MNIMLIIGFVFLILVAGSMWWRWKSRRHSLPCPTWLSVLVSHRFDGLLGTQTTLDRLGLQPGQRVLEIGPGTGRLLIPAAKRVLPGGEAVGLDIQPGMLKRLEKRVQQAGVANLKAVLGDAAETEFLPASFDVVFLCTVLGEIPKREEALRKCYQALKPGGRLSITEIFPDPHFQSRQRVQTLAESVGFIIEEIQGSWYFFTAHFTKK